VIGAHKGLVNHTIGQRKGIGIAGPQPLYVLSLDTAKNRLMVGSRTQAAARRVQADGITLTSGIWPEEPISCQAMVRYRGELTNATVTLGDNGSGTASVLFNDDTAKLPIASPGQAVVFYDGEEVLGGGTIRVVERVTEHGGGDAERN